MSKRDPLLSDEYLSSHTPISDDWTEGPCAPVTPTEVRNIYEAARAKDAELIQRLVNSLEYVASYDNGCPLPTWEKGYNEAWAYANKVREDAASAGFKPTE